MAVVSIHLNISMQYSSHILYCINIYMIPIFVALNPHLPVCVLSVCLCIGYRCGVIPYLPHSIPPSILTSLNVCLSLCLYPCFSMNTCLTVCLSVCPSACLYICLSACI